MALLAVMSGALLFSNLGARYLWQDEAACAVLSERMMLHGRPLSYDGRNLITMDEYRDDEQANLPLRSGSPESAIAYYVAKGDFKADTSWIGQPWGQFVLAGVSLSIFGHGTVQARLPFALAAVLTVLCLYVFVRRRFDDRRMAWIASLLLLGNTFWFLHARQSRYYSPDTLFCLLTLMSYMRWQDRARWGAAAFVLSAWCWFQVDFAALWPCVGLLALDAVRVDRRRWRRTVVVMAILGACITPFIFHYEMLGRVKQSFDPWGEKLITTIFNVNQFQLPLIVLPVLAWLWSAKRRERTEGAPGERRVVGLCVAILLAQMVWMTSVGPAAYYRYLVSVTPLSCLVVAYVIVRLTSQLVPVAAGARRRLAVAAAGCLLFVLSPLPSLPGSLLVPGRYRHQSVEPNAIWLRPELGRLVADLTGRSPDPNRAVIEYLRPRLEPGDEILANYEDIPLMFYTDNAVRGGIPAFRVRDPDAQPPRFAIIRHSVLFVHRDVFREELMRHDWLITELAAPDIPWGNNPGPNNRYMDIPYQERPIQVLENLGQS